MTISDLTKPASLQNRQPLCLPLPDSSYNSHNWTISTAAPTTTPKQSTRLKVARFGASSYQAWHRQRQRNLLLLPAQQCYKNWRKFVGDGKEEGHREVNSVENTTNLSKNNEGTNDSSKGGDGLNRSSDGSKEHQDMTKSQDSPPDFDEQAFCAVYGFGDYYSCKVYDRRGRFLVAVMRLYKSI